jgi:putative phosphonate metabolism protein
MDMENDTVAPYRVAVYYAPPPDSAWWHAGSEWLGRCARTGQTLTQPAIEGITTDDVTRLTDEPRRYGWHATLKAPFRLAAGQTLDDVRASLRRLCRGRTPFDLAPLQPIRMGDFLALRPRQPQAALDRLAADAVVQLQPLALPLNAEELARRRRAGLTPEQDRLLLAWGYPHVLQNFRFHLSLTGPVGDMPASMVAALLQAASARFDRLAACHIDRVSLFVESTPGAPFELLEQIGFEP